MKAANDEPEFCPYCGAGVGEHRRHGEGTCPRCDAPFVIDHRRVGRYVPVDDAPLQA